MTNLNFQFQNITELKRRIYLYCFSNIFHMGCPPPSPPLHIAELKSSPKRRFSNNPLPSRSACSRPGDISPTQFKRLSFHNHNHKIMEEKHFFLVVERLRSGYLPPLDLSALYYCSSSVSRGLPPPLS